MTRRSTHSPAPALTRLWRALCSLSVADLLIAAGVATLTAAGALVLENLVQPSATFGQMGVYTVVAVSGLAVAVSGILRRNHLLRAQGTLYYVRVLQSGMDDTHSSELNELRSTHQDVRTVTHWITRDEDDGRAPGHDYTHTLARVAGQVQTAMNEDQIDTSFNIVPNMLWPLAVGLGSMHYLMPSTRLIEPSGPSGRKVTPGFNQADWRVPGHGAPSERPAAGRLVTMPISGTPGSPDATLLTLDISGYLTPPPGYAGVGSSVLLAAARNAWHERRQGTVIARPTDRDGLPYCVLSPWDDYDPGGLLLEDPVARQALPGSYIAHECAHRIRAIIRRENPRLVLLCARLPKTVAFALGLQLATPQHLESCPKVCHAVACTRPWTRLATLNYDPATRQYRYYRVHGDQPSLDEVEAVLRPQAD